MNRWQWLALVAGGVGFVLMCVYCPWQRVERIYEVVPAGSGPIVGMARTDNLRAVQVRPAGYAWCWAPPPGEVAWFGTEVAIQPDYRRLGFQFLVWAGVVLVAILLLRRRDAQGAPPGESPSPQADRI